MSLSVEEHGPSWAEKACAEWIERKNSGSNLIVLEGAKEHLLKIAREEELGFVATDLYEALSFFVHSLDLTLEAVIEAQKKGKAVLIKAGADPVLLGVDDEA